MKKNGFTLIELMIAMVIIGILATIGLTAYIGAKRSSRDAKRKADLQQIRTALELYRSDLSISGGSYPQNLTSLEPNYIKELPTDPLSYTYYYNRLTASTYNLCAHLETGDATKEVCGGTNLCGSNCNYKVTNP